MTPRITIDQTRIGEFCRRHHIRRLSLFGSVLRDDFRPESDVDVLVEFAAGHRPGLAFFEMEDELERMLQRRVDFLTPAFLGVALRGRVMAEAQPIYYEG